MCTTNLTCVGLIDTSYHLSGSPLRCEVASTKDFQNLSPQDPYSSAFSACSVIVRSQHSPVSFLRYVTLLSHVNLSAQSHFTKISSIHSVNSHSFKGTSTVLNIYFCMQKIPQ